MGKARTKAELLQRIYWGYVEVEDTYHLVRSSQRSAARRYKRGVSSRFAYEVEMQQAKRHYERLYKLLNTLQAHYDEVLAMP